MSNNITPIAKALRKRLTALLIFAHFRKKGARGDLKTFGAEQHHPPLAPPIKGGGNYLLKIGKNQRSYPHRIARNLYFPLNSSLFSMAS
ncbi:hypothetical protein M1N07_02500 [Thermodesulfovibrionales bacterium]|nr:hypothetical protein [Thermodesulfovibrionales bacterium]